MLKTEPDKKHYRIAFESHQAQQLTAPLTEAEKKRLNELLKIQPQSWGSNIYAFIDHCRTALASCPCDKCRNFDKCAKEKLACQAYVQWMTGRQYRHTYN